ncbi:MAG: urease accessory protein UreF [Pseudonocardia sp.]
MELAGLLLLADSRLPAGGHVHSGGVEALVDRGLLRDVADLALVLDARVRTAGLCAAAVAAVGATVTDGWARWDAAVDVRTPSPALREASRAQGAALLRTAAQAWPAVAALTGLRGFGRPHYPLVLGAACAAAGAGPGQAAALAVHHLIGGAATAAVRLLGLDPLRVAGIQAALAGTADRVAAEATKVAAAATSADDPDLLPSDATPLPEIMAELHHASEVTLFAS